MGSILVVDDEEDILNLVEYNLKKEGYQVFTARNGQDGVKVASEVKPHLIILDVMMPRKDGFTLGREVREKDKEVPIIFLTAKALKEDVLEGFKIGADDYITKPIRIEELLKKVGEYLM